MKVGSRDVFISYSRKDADFARRLHAALESRGRAVWIDWQDIPPTAEWWAEIRAAIDSAHAFVFLMSEHSLASRVCADELAHAAEARKRLIPVVRGAKIDGPVPEPLRPINWVYFPDAEQPGPFETGLTTLLTAVETDLDHVRRHTRLLVRAREWDTRGRNASFTLRGHDLREAESWLSAAEGKEPRPTPLHRAYLSSSRQGAARRQRIALGAALAGLVATSSLSVVAFVKSIMARESQLAAEVQTGVAQTQTKEAQRQREEAVRQRDEARRQASIALARQLAAQAEALPATRSTGLPTAVLLAAEGLARASNAETFGAMHRLLPMLPRRIAHLDTNSNEVVFALAPSGRLAAWQPDSGESIIDHTRGAVVVSELAEPGRSRLIELPAPPERMAFAPDESLLVIATTDGMVRGVPLSDSPAWTTHVGDRLSVLAFDHAGRVLIGAKGILGSLDPYTGQTVLGGRLPEGSHPAAFSPDGTVAAVTAWNQGTRQGGIAFLSMDSAAQVGGVPLTASPGDVSFSDDGRRAVVVLESAVAVVDIAASTIIATLDTSDLGSGFSGNRVMSARLSPSGDRVVTAEFERTVRVWDVATGRERLRLPQKGPPYLAVFSPDGRAIAVGADDDTARLWDAATGAELLRFTHNPGEYCSNLRFSADGSKLITHAFRTSVWDLSRAGGPFIVNHGSYVDRLLHSPDGRFLAAVGRDNQVSVWDGLTGAPISRFQTPPTSNGATRLAAFSPDGERLAVLSEDAAVYVWSVASERLIARLAPVTSSRLLVFSPDGRRLATVNEQTTGGGRRTTSSLTVWDVDSARACADFPTQAPVEALAFSPDGDRIACHRQREAIVVLTLPEGDDLKKHDLADTPVDFGFRVSPAASGGEPLALAELSLARRLQGDREDGRSLTGAAISPDGRLVLIGMPDRTARLYDLRSGREVARIAHDGLNAEHTAISPAGGLAASIANNIDSNSSDLRIIELPSATPTALLSFPQPARALTFSPDGSRLAIAFDSGEVRSLLMRPDDLIAEARRRVGRDLSPDERAQFLGPVTGPGIATAAAPEPP